MAKSAGSISRAAGKMRFTLTVEGKTPPLLPFTTERPDVDAPRLPEVVSLGGKRGLAGISGRKAAKGRGYVYTFRDATQPERPPVIVLAMPEE